jgi:hypothetical protein
MMIHFASNFTAQLFEPASASLEVLRVVLLMVVAVVVSVSLYKRDDEAIQITVPNLFHP